MRLMKNDAVYKIQEAAYQNLKRLGEDVELPPRKKGDLVKDVSKVIIRIKKVCQKVIAIKSLKRNYRR